MSKMDSHNFAPGAKVKVFGTGGFDGATSLNQLVGKARIKTLLPGDNRYRVEFAKGDKLIRECYVDPNQKRDGISAASPRALLLVSRALSRIGLSMKRPHLGRRQH